MKMKVENTTQRYFKNMQVLQTFLMINFIYRAINSQKAVIYRNATCPIILLELI